MNRKRIDELINEAKYSSNLIIRHKNIWRFDDGQLDCAIEKMHNAGNKEELFTAYKEYSDICKKLDWTHSAIVASLLQNTIKNQELKINSIEIVEWFIDEYEQERTLHNDEHQKSEDEMKEDKDGSSYNIDNSNSKSDVAYELTENDFGVIKKHCGQDLSFRLQSVQNKMSNEVIKIVNTGMVSSGKSSLYNIITGNTDKEHFPTGAARTTTSADSLCYEGFEYIDTPGIDVKVEDDVIAFDTIVGADIIIMVHNIKTGPLIRSEVEWLKRISDSLTSENMKKNRLIFVCTWKDSREKEPTYPDIISDVRNMVFDTVGTEIPFFELSTKKYMDGLLKGKELLCNNSGVIEFKSFLIEFANKYSQEKQKYVAAEYSETLRIIKEKLEKVREERQTKVENKKNSIKQKFGLERKVWYEAYRYFRQKRLELDNLKKKTF